jgi:hypothetical protein
MLANIQFRVSLSSCLLYKSRDQIRSKLHFNIILTSKSRSPELSLPPWFSDQTFLVIPVTMRSLLCSDHLLVYFDHTNNI